MVLCWLAISASGARAAEDIFVPGAALKIEAAGGVGGAGPAWHDEQGGMVEGVDHLDPDGKVSRIIGHEVERVKGVLVSDEDRFLYDVDNNNNNLGGARKLWRFDLPKDGNVDPGSRKLIFDWGTG